MLVGKMVLADHWDSDGVLVQMGAPAGGGAGATDLVEAEL